MWILCILWKNIITIKCGSDVNVDVKFGLKDSCQPTYSTLLVRVYLGKISKYQSKKLLENWLLKHAGYKNCRNTLDSKYWRNVEYFLL